MSAPAVGLKFEEKMHGGFAMGATDPAGGARRGKAAGTSLTLKSTISVKRPPEANASP